MRRKIKRKRKREKEKVGGGLFGEGFDDDGAGFDDDDD